MRAAAHMVATGRGWKLLPAAVVMGIAAAAGGVSCTLFQGELVSKGQALYEHYCMHCHGENGRQNEGYNWGHMPDPRPKDLSAKEEMSTFKDEELFGTISRDMKDTTPELGDKIGDDEFAVPTMPTFKYTLSEEEIWAIVAYVRTLHGMKLTYDVEGRKKELQDRLQAAQQKFDQAKQALEEAEKKAAEEAEKKGVETDDAATSKEQEVLAAAAKELEIAKTAAANFSTRPKYAAVPRLELTVSPTVSVKLSEQVRLQCLPSSWRFRRSGGAGAGSSGLSVELLLGLSLGQISSEHEAGDTHAESRPERSGRQGHHHVPWDLAGAEARAADRQGLQLNVVLSCEFQVF